MEHAHGGLVRFVCPTCQRSSEVDETMRRTLLSRGCVFCGSAVTATAFEGGTA
jgi:endogenous inhibitor of DNA gyrase (YacG/DUF329 family)